MKNQKIMAFLLAAPLITTVSLAQTSDSLSETSLSASVVTARCQYTPTDRACAQLRDSSPVGTGADEATLAQASRQPGPRRPYMVRPRYSGFATEPSGRHVLIGALIGSGLGAAVGAKGNRDQHPGVETKAIVLGASIGGLLGAAIGAAVPSFHSRHLYRHHRWPDDEEQASRPDQGSGTVEGLKAEAQSINSQRPAGQTQGSLALPLTNR